MKIKKIAPILASVGAISLLCTVPIFIESYHERRRERPDETLATLYLKEGATFYFMLNCSGSKIDNTRILPQYFSNLFLTTFNIYMLIDFSIRSE